MQRRRLVVALVTAGLAVGCSLVTALDGLRGSATETPDAQATSDGSAIVDAGPVAKLADAISVGAGQDHSCAVVSTGAVYCWGNNVTGQLGVPADSVLGTTKPMAVQGLPGPAVSVFAGYGGACAILATGALWCWGTNGRGQMGIAADSAAHLPMPISANGTPLASVTTVTFGIEVVCAIAKGTVYCWGDGNLVGLANKPKAPPLPPTASTSGVAVSNGILHVCAASGNGVTCWGDNSFGVLGNDAAVPYSTPQAVPLGSTSAIVTLASGDFFTLAGSANGVVYGWGLNSVNQAGNIGRPYGFGIVKEAAGATALTAGIDFSCFLINGGELRCMGNNSSGQLGTGLVDQGGHDAGLVGADAGLLDVLAVSAGFHHVCAIRKGGATPRGIVCWGSNASGELGDGTKALAAAPVEVLAP